MNHKRLKKELYLRLMGNELLQNAACLHAVAPSEVEDFRSVGYWGPAFVAHNGICPEEFQHLPSPEEAEERWPQLRNRRVVLFLSRLSPEKGIDELLPAWSAMVRKSSYADALLVLAGPDDRGYRLSVEEMIGETGLQKHSLLTGMVQGREKLALMSRADVYTLPSYSEGFSNSLLENLASGTPAVITPPCNFPEVVEANAGYCADPARDSLREAFERILSLPKESLAVMGNNGRRLVTEHFTWAVTARKIAAVYQAILQGQEVPLHPEPIPVGTDGKAVVHSHENRNRKAF